ncbi:NADH-cytochrome b5 reductase-like [Dipsacomyces acuminosporus]|nr:NADH-cytochrome b5 reductase-like [Dipsacomyces acuminosporus]
MGEESVNPAVLALYEEIARAKKRAAAKRKAEEERKNGVYGVIQQGDEVVLKLPPPPPKPLPGDCCNSGCTPCIKDTYWAAMQDYNAEVDALKRHYEMVLRGESTQTMPQRRRRSSGLLPGYLDPLRFTTIRILSIVRMNDYSMTLVLNATARDFLLAAGEHIHIRAVVGDDVKITRPFTPVMIEAPDRMVRPHLLIRLYDFSEMSQYFKSLLVGSTLTIRGPVSTKENITRAFSGSACILAAGGSGIAPMFQLLQFAHVNASYHDKQIVLVQCSRDHTGIWLAKEIAQLAAEMRGLSHHIFLSEEAPADGASLPNVTCEKLCFDSLRLIVPRDAVGCHAVVCGPGSFNSDISCWLQKLGVEDVQTL